VSATPLPLTPRVRRFLPSLPFLLIGGTNAVLNYVIYRSLVALFGGPHGGRAALAQAIAYAVCMVVSYVLNRRFSFGGVPHSRGAAARFLAAQLSALVLSAALIQLFVWLLGAPELPGGAFLARYRTTLAWVLATGLVTFYNFNVMRRWVFASAPARA
jgi:putative flippase GtrA